MIIFGRRDCLPYVLSVAQSDPEEVNRAGALALLPLYFSGSEGAPKEVLRVISGRLKDSSAFVRLGAAIALAELGDSRQAVDLESAIAQEPALAIREQMERALSKLKSRPPK